jgi:hypothetical protein
MVGSAPVHLARNGSGSWQRDDLPYMPAAPFFRIGSPWIVAATGGYAHVAVTGSAVAVNAISQTRYWTNASGTWRGYTIANDAGNVSLTVDAGGDRHAVYPIGAEVHYLTTRP